MTQEILQRLKKEALQEHIPIMQEESLLYCIDFIGTHKVKSVLEVGTAIGHWSIRCALANPLLTIETLEKDLSRYDRALKNVQMADLSTRIHCRHLDVMDYQPDQNFDLIFLDGPKSQQRLLIERFLPYLNPNGCFIVDNVHFHDLVHDKDAYIQRKNLHGLLRKIDEFKVWIKQYPDVVTQEIDVGDGLLLVFRKYQD